MQNKLSSVGDDLTKDRCWGVKMRELNDTEKGPVKLIQWVKIAHSFLHVTAKRFQQYDFKLVWVVLHPSV